MELSLSQRNYIKPPSRLLSLILLALLLLPGVAASNINDDEDEAKGALLAALMLLEHGNHEAAIGPLDQALAGLPIIGDHILIRLAESYALADEYTMALETAERLLSEYPKSPARRDAIKIQTLSTVAISPDRADKTFRSYLRRYPSDDGIRFEYADFLDSTGKKNKSQHEFLRIYINAGALSLDARSRISELKISDKDMLKRARRLIRLRNYSRAEKILASLIKKKKYMNNKSIKRDLAKSRFNMRHYSKAVHLYLELGDLYNAARCYIRSGKERQFYQTVERMIKKRDPKTPKILISHANDLRREGHPEQAMQMLQRSINIFPGASEISMWTLGWHLYSAGEYEKALEEFSKLSDKYGDNKYRYWTARAMEQTGQDATDMYLDIMDGGYYSYLAGLKTGVTVKAQTPIDPSGDFAIDLERVDTLIDLGLHKEAASDLAIISKRRISDNDLMAVAYRMQEARRYRDAILLMLRFPEDRRPDNILYPLAYWETVSEITDTYTVDPLVVLSVMREESRFDSDARSPVGAIGLMQLMPTTARYTARKAKVHIMDEDSIYDIHNNIRLGTHYLDGLLREFKSLPASLAAYNAGESRVRKWLKQGKYGSEDEFVEDIPFTETRNYVKRIMRSLSKYRSCLDAGVFRLSAREL